MRPVTLTGFFKRGSTWTLSVIRKGPTGAPIDMTGLVTRAMFCGAAYE